MQTVGGAVNACAAGGDSGCAKASESLLGAFEAAAGLGEADGGVMAFDAGGDRGDLRGRRAQAAGDGQVEAVAEVVQALAAAADKTLQPIVDLRDGEGGEALARQHELVADGAARTGVESLHALFDAVLGCGDEFSSGGGRGGAQIGDEVRDGEVGLVPDRRNDGQLRRSNGAGEGLVVEAGEVLERAAAAGDEDQVDLTRMLIEPADAGNDGGGASWALDRGGIDEQVEARMAAADDVDDVVQDGAAGGSDHADCARECRQRALAVGVEQALGEQAGLELLEGELERAGAARLQGLGDELQLAAGLVDGDAAAREDSEAVLRAKAEQVGLLAKEHNLELGIAVFEREVDVAGGCGTAVGDLATDPDVLVLLLDLAANAGDEVADTPDAALGECGGGLGEGRGKLGLGALWAGGCLFGGGGGFAAAARCGSRNRWGPVRRSGEEEAHLGSMAGRRGSRRFSGGRGLRLAGRLGLEPEAGERLWSGDIVAVGHIG